MSVFDTKITKVVSTASVPVRATHAQAGERAVIRQWAMCFLKSSTSLKRPALKTNHL